MGLKSRLSTLVPSRNSTVSWWALLQTVGPPVLICAALIWAGLHFVHSAPPQTLTISSGPKGSNFDNNAQRYAKILARDGIHLKVVQSAGSLENLKRLADPKSHVDIAFVQAGLSSNTDTDDLES